MDLERIRTKQEAREALVRSIENRGGSGTRKTALKASSSVPTMAVSAMPTVMVAGRNLSVAPGTIINVAQQYGAGSTVTNAGTFVPLDSNGAFVVAAGGKYRIHEPSDVKSTFLATISHEIRTPLNGVIGMNQLLLESGDLSNRQRSEYCRIIKQSGERLLELVDNILDLSKMESDSLKLEDAPFDLEELVDDFMKGEAVRAQSKGLAVGTMVDPSGHTLVRGDAARVRQALRILVDNAIKFTDEGTVMVHAEMEKVRAGRALWKISVLDTGIGVEEELQGYLFEMFSQCDHGATRRYGGAGLGLAILKRLVSMMGGELGVKSVPGTGSTFWVKIPFQTQERQVPRFVPLEKPLRVLILEQNEFEKEVEKRYLEAAGCSVAVAESTEEVLSHFDGSRAPADKQFDVVMITDEEMSKVTVEQTPHRRKGDPVAVALLPRAKSFSMHRWSWRFADFLLKPITRDSVYRMLSNPLVNGGKLPSLSEESGAPTDRITRLVRRSEGGAKRLGAGGGGGGKGFHKRSLSTSHAGHAAAAGGVDKPHVLVAEDDVTNVRVVSLMLSREYQLTVAPNGVEAVKCFREDPEKFAAILMDYHMPEMDGVRATREIRADEKTLMGEKHHAPVPIIALTAGALESDRQQFIDAGMNDILIKPVKKSVLVKTLKRWVNGQGLSPKGLLKA